MSMGGIEKYTKKNTHNSFQTVASAVQWLEESLPIMLTTTR